MLSKVKSLIATLGNVKCSETAMIALLCLNKRGLLTKQRALNISMHQETAQCYVFFIVLYHQNKMLTPANELMIWSFDDDEIKSIFKHVESYNKNARELLFKSMHFALEHKSIICPHKTLRILLMLNSCGLPSLDNGQRLLTHPLKDVITDILCSINGKITQAIIEMIFKHQYLPAVRAACEYLRYGEKTVTPGLRYHARKIDVEILYELLKRGDGALAYAEENIILPYEKNENGGYKINLSICNKGMYDEHRLCFEPFWADVLKEKEITRIANALANGKIYPRLTINFHGNQLYSQFNLLGNNGAKLLANALSSGRAPVQLTIGLSYCHIGAAGVEYFASALSSGKAPSKLTLNISDNGIDNEGIKSLVNAIRSGKTPDQLTLDLRGNAYKVEEFAEAVVASGNHDKIKLIFDNNMNDLYDSELKRLLSIKPTNSASTTEMLPTSQTSASSNSASFCFFQKEPETSDTSEKEQENSDVPETGNVCTIV